MVDHDCPQHGAVPVLGAGLGGRGPAAAPTFEFSWGAKLWGISSVGFD